MLTFSEEILNGKLHFMFSGIYIQTMQSLEFFSQISHFLGKSSTKSFTSKFFHPFHKVFSSFPLNPFVPNAPFLYLILLSVLVNFEFSNFFINCQFLTKNSSSIFNFEIGKNKFKQKFALNGLDIR